MWCSASREPAANHSRIKFNGGATPCTISSLMSYARSEVPWGAEQTTGDARCVRMKCHDAALERNQFTMRLLRYVPNAEFTRALLFFPIMKSTVPGGQAGMSKYLRYGRATVVKGAIQRAVRHPGASREKRLPTRIVPVDQLLGQ